MDSLDSLFSLGARGNNVIGHWHFHMRELKHIFVGVRLCGRGASRDGGSRWMECEHTHTH